MCQSGPEINCGFHVCASAKPPAPEWPTQLFLPERPYMLATWIPGTVIDAHVIEFERKSVYPNDSRLPDVLVFDKDYQFKFALEGTDPTVQRRRGTLYPWKRGQILDCDDTNAFVQVIPNLEPDDICFGFYSYRELDVVFTGIDCTVSDHFLMSFCVLDLVDLAARTCRFRGSLPDLWPSTGIMCCVHAGMVGQSTWPQNRTLDGRVRQPGVPQLCPRYFALP